MGDDLTSGEIFFLSVSHNFDFLRLRGYRGDSFNITNRDEFMVSFYSHLKKKKVTIIEYRSSGLLDFYVDDNRLFKWKRKYLKDYLGMDIKLQSVSHLAKLVKQNEPLMNDLCGQKT